MPAVNDFERMPGLMFSSSISVVVIGLMLFMAMRLYAGNRRRAYRSLLVSLGFILVHHSLQLVLSLGWLFFYPGLALAGKALQGAAFIVINFAVFELYYKRRQRTRLWFYGLLVVEALAALGDILMQNGTDSGRLGTYLLDVFLLLLLPLLALMFGPHIGQRRRYAAGLAAAFAAQVCRMTAGFGAAGGFYETAGEVLQVAYYVLLFMLLFERVVELLTAAYRSSITDGLTNLYVRRYFVSQLERAMRSGKPVGVIFSDIDNFKRLNDTHGHHKADGVLKQVSSIFTEEVQGIGVAGRYGGEEIVAFVTGPALTALQTAETIRARVEKDSLVTLSIGVCTAVPGAGRSAEELLKRADLAMYHSKGSGKNRVTDYDTMPETDRKPAAMKR